MPRLSTFVSYEDERIKQKTADEPFHGRATVKSTLSTLRNHPMGESEHQPLRSGRYADQPVDSIMLYIDPALADLTTIILRYIEDW